MQQKTLHVAALLVLLLVSMVLFFLDLGSLPFYTKGEPREALQVWREVHAGEWILPLRNGTEIPSKPPLFHWLGGLTSLLSGQVNEFTVRFPSAALATLVVFGVYGVALRKWGVWAGIFAALTLATSFEWIRAARAARVDMALAACLTGSFLAFDVIIFSRLPSATALSILYGCMALGVLAKGPIGLVLPVLVIGTYFILRRDFGTVRSLHPLLGVAAALLIPAAWYALATIEGGDAFVQKQLIKENVARFLGEGAVSRSHAQPFYYHLFSLLGGFAPWSLFLFPLGTFLYRKRRELVPRGYFFPLVWFTVVFVFYSAASGKRAVYLLPAYPALALLVGAWWSDLEHADPRRGSRV